MSVSNILKAIPIDLLENTLNPLIWWIAPTNLHYRAPLRAWILRYVHVRSKAVSTECASRHFFLCCKIEQKWGFFVFWVKPKWKQILNFKLCYFWALLGLWRGNNNVIAMKVVKIHNDQFQKCQCRTPEDVRCVGTTEHAVVWGSCPFLCYWTSCWTPESWVLRMSAQEIILPECYKGQGNTIFHFSPCWMMDYELHSLYKLQEKKKIYAGSDTPWPKNGTASVSCWEARAPCITWWGSPTYLLW